MANIGWTNEKVLKFIRLYREKRILWDPNNGDYYNKNLKHEAWKDISLRMGCDLLELRRKMDYLMAGLRREKMKLTKARQSGIGRTVSTWFAYDPLKFLLGRTKSKEMIKKIRMQFARKYDMEGEEQPAQSDNQEEEANQTNEDHEVTVESPKPMTREHDDTIQTHNVTLNSVSYNPPPETPVIQSAASRSLVNDECQMFANYLACKLRSYTKKTRNTAQYQINHILYLADDGQFEVPTGGMTTQNVQIVNLPRKVVAAPFAHLANNSSILVNSSNITNGDDICEIDIKEEN